MSYTVVDDALAARLEDDDERKKWLFLEPHGDFEGFWKVNSFNADLTYDLNEVVGPYRAVGPADLPLLAEVASQFDYKLAFFEDPSPLLDVDPLRPPPFEVESSFSDTINGMLPFQLRGFNRLRDLEAGIARWDTGTGKSVLASALVKYHLLNRNFDLCVFVVKKHNKVNMVRRLKKLVDVDAIYITGSQSNRDTYYQRVADEMAAGKPVVMVINYEKFRDDFVTWKKERGPTGKARSVPDQMTPVAQTFFEDARLLCFWDEMPMKLKTRTTKLYMAVTHCLYRAKAPQVNYDRKRSSALTQYMLSATPIENDPEDWFNCCRILAPRVYGTVTDFHNEYVQSWNWFNDHKPETWHNLDKMRLKTAHLIDDVDQTDPEVAKFFPHKIEDEIVIDWNEKDRATYTRLQELARELKDTEDEVMVMAFINLLQMMCDAPSMVMDSAARREAYERAYDEYQEAGGKEPKLSGSKAATTLLSFLDEGVRKTITDQGHTKFEELHHLLFTRHPEAKFVIFSTWNDCLHPILMKQFDNWGISYVRYAGTDRQRQAAHDAFQQDPSIRIFLSSDAGSDSIDLEQARVTVDYNLPWKWTVKVQRRNRIDRPTSPHEKIYCYSLMMADSVEERRQKVIERKHSYHQALFGDAAELGPSAKITREDLLYILG